jgi:hypothetical protein
MTDSCSRLHDIFNKMKRFNFNFQEQEIPKNGVYILFQAGELAHRGDRIVRIGTHTGQDQLPSRLKQHFLKMNKDRSIFRKNIGRAILNQANDPFLDDWENDLTERAKKDEFSSKIDSEKKDQVEQEVSNYMKENFSFVVFPLETKEERIAMEKKLISEVSNCQECKPSDSWFGKNSPEEKISSSGLWQVQHVFKHHPLVEEDLKKLENITR